MKTSEIIASIKSCGTAHECKSMKIFPNAFITDLKKTIKKTKKKHISKMSIRAYNFMVNNIIGRKYIL